MNNNFLVVGAGFGQLPAIKAAKELGLTVVAVDVNSTAVGMDLADIALQVDLIDSNAIVDVAKKYNVRGVMTMQSDVGIPAVGAVVDALALPGNGTSVAERCSNKILMRRALDKAGVNQPKYAVVSSIDEAEGESEHIGFPCILKAPDSSGSRGVIKINKKDDFTAAFSEASRYTKGEDFILEEFVKGIEVGAQGFSVDGSCVSVLVHDDYMSAPPYMVPIGHAFPSTLPEHSLKKAEEAVRTCVQALGIKDGPSNIDLIIDNYGNAKVIEAGARIGATCLPELVCHHSGLDWVKLSILSSIGQMDVPSLVKKKSQPVVAFVLQSPKDGIFEGFKFHDHTLVEADEILEWEVTVTRGEHVSMLRKGTDRIGKVVVKGDSVHQALVTARSFVSNIGFFVKP